MRIIFAQNTFNAKKTPRRSARTTRHMNWVTAICHLIDLAPNDFKTYSCLLQSPLRKERLDLGHSNAARVFSSLMQEGPRPEIDKTTIKITLTTDKCSLGVDHEMQASYDFDPDCQFVWI